jgi:hypothetical protein
MTEEKLVKSILHSIPIAVNFSDKSLSDECVGSKGCADLRIAFSTIIQLLIVVKN